MSIESAKVISLIQHSDEQKLDKATISSNTSKNIILNVNGKDTPAKVAFSCLVQPEINDVVLISGNEYSGFYILSILERPDATDMSLSFPGNTVLNSSNGSLQLHASETVALTANKLTCIAENSIHKSEKAYVNYSELNATGENANVSFKTIKVLSKMMSTIAQHTINKFKTYLRHTEQADQISAGQMTRDVKDIYSMNSKYTVMVSKKDTKIDGERIHMG